MSVAQIDEAQKEIQEELKEIQETQDELVEARQHNSWAGGWAKTIGLASVVSIALGGFNDSFDAIEKIVDFGLSQMTDIPSHKKLDKIYIRSSADILDETFGAPVYIKRSSNDDVIKYYQDDNFILSAISRDDAIVAYLVFPNEGFAPETLEHAGGTEFFDNHFNAIESVNEIRASYARTGNYYIEENNGGEFGFLYASISGVSEFISPMSDGTQKLLAGVTDALMLDENVAESVQSLRLHTKPNFYGYSTLGIGALEDAILSNTEYRLINKI
ncbi:ETEC_3214 domain-containing protein [Vibrio maerlii]|uniref:ETEC_3214 domain-containing protein n=1 Tax=Vibrio maerlii TaxID=2231648 RepID=UPI000E3C7E4A|nr:ETEC_3214 domain-containing protein [Vibrio maerlii]